MSAHPVRALAVALLAGSIAACGGSSNPAEDAGVSSANGGYPAPRCPSYFQPPKSIDDLMPAARGLG